MTSVVCINTYINISLYENGSPKAYGKYIFVVQQTGGQFQLTVYQAGQQPLVTFVITPSIRWILQNKVYVYMNDTEGKQWLVTFGDENTAVKVTAFIGKIISAEDSHGVGTYEPSTNNNTKSIDYGDKIKFSYFAFAWQNDNINLLIEKSEEKNAGLTFVDLPQGLALGMIGMKCGQFRVVSVPPDLMMHSNGTKDPKFQDCDIVFVVFLLRAKFSSKKTPIPAIAERTKPVQKQPEPEPQFHYTPPPRYTRKLDEIPPVTLSRFNLNKDADPDDRLLHIEEFIDSRLEIFTDVPEDFEDPEGLMAALKKIAIDVKIKDQELQKVKRLYNSQLGTIQQQELLDKRLKMAEKEREDLKRRHQELEKKIKYIEENPPKPTPISEEKKQFANKKVEKLIKKLMGSVYSDLQEVMEQDKKYSGEHISTQLFELLRKHSFDVLNEINTNGLLV